MCVVSMIMDHYEDKWRDSLVSLPSDTFSQFPFRYTPQITPEELEEFRRLLERAREYDRRNNEPDCELEEKKKKVRELADKLGVKIDFL